MTTVQRLLGSKRRARGDPARPGRVKRFLGAKHPGVGAPPGRVLISLMMAWPAGSCVTVLCWRPGGATAADREAVERYLHWVEEQGTVGMAEVEQERILRVLELPDFFGPVVRTWSMGPFLEGRVAPAAPGVSGRCGGCETSVPRKEQGRLDGVRAKDMTAIASDKG